jgi:hypothetical protein
LFLFKSIELEIVSVTSGAASTSERGGIIRLPPQSHGPDSGSWRNPANDHQVRLFLLLQVFKTMDCEGSLFGGDLW